jgi:hypothetical protein
MVLFMDYNYCKFSESDFSKKVAFEAMNKKTFTLIFFGVTIFMILFSIYQYFIRQQFDLFTSVGFVLIGILFMGLIYLLMVPMKIILVKNNLGNIELTKVSSFYITHKLVVEARKNPSLLLEKTGTEGGRILISDKPLYRPILKYSQDGIEKKENISFGLFVLRGKGAVKFVKNGTIGAIPEELGQQIANHLNIKIEIKK